MCHFNIETVIFVIFVILKQYLFDRADRQYPRHYPQIIIFSPIISPTDNPMFKVKNKSTLLILMR